MYLHILAFCEGKEQQTPWEVVKILLQELGVQLLE